MSCTYSSRTTSTGSEVPGGGISARHLRVPVRSFRRPPCGDDGRASSSRKLAHGPDISGLPKPAIPGSRRSSRGNRLLTQLRPRPGSAARRAGTRRCRGRGAIARFRRFRAVRSHQRPPPRPSATPGPAKPPDPDPGVLYAGRPAREAGERLAVPAHVIPGELPAGHQAAAEIGSDRHRRVERTAHLVQAVAMSFLEAKLTGIDLAVLRVTRPTGPGPWDALVTMKVFALICFPLPSSSPAG